MMVDFMLVNCDNIIYYFFIINRKILFYLYTVKHVIQSEWMPNHPSLTKGGNDFRLTINF